MKKTFPTFINTLLIIMISSIILLAIFWIPHIYNYLSSSISIIQDNKTLKLLYYILSYIIILVALTVFILSFKFSSAIKKDNMFSISIVKLLKLISKLILVDCILFTGCIITLLFFKEYLLSPSLIFFCIIGYAVCFMLFILSNYVKEATILKEEALYTL